ncbi:integrin subunit alpha 8 [Lobosporangium transversale]|uniref:Phosphatidylinositol-glycan-specific phospholipase D n=1 Tax=Lobosporangium transversale TaxID=64571 RepID=A0A1Y2GFC1_9FUNG|nr:hypothetical protein BCR41DRAFT_424119 [Lobosporangium transversale]KAF9907517.1 integrin subunit alpha 8 [Lobosporangium transversale]ORZ09311.1 hypothetical protein BCR41DRAFT_424119 [Lobosporangium transversale]|eukprot:XP_021878764.1 hypothetical protein BCR41DRAFT_424119 [Lobosporangium transversale]
MLRRSLCRTLSLSVALGLVIVTLNSKRIVLVDSCGVTIHNEVAFRASRILSAHSLAVSFSPFHPSTASTASSPSSSSRLLSLSNLNTDTHQNSVRNQSRGLYDYIPLLAQKESLFAGSFFPDWGYDCIGKIWNQAAEEAHWPPFAEASIRYILETYPKPWDDHVKALIIFLFGIVSHSLGDMSWHALHGLDAGFINTLAQISFQGDYSQGHTLADIGAEFVLSHMSKMDHLLTMWKVPVRDISAIYKRMGYRVPGPVLSHCMRNGFAGAQANARLGSQLFPVYASRSPFLVEQIEDYPMGGLRDMSEWTIDCWSGLVGYLDQERKLPSGIGDRNNTFNMCYALWEERTRRGRRAAMERTREGRVRHQHGHRGQGTSGVDGALALIKLSDAGLKVVTDVDDNTGMVTFSIKEIVDDDQKAKEMGAGEMVQVLNIADDSEAKVKDDGMGVFKSLFRSDMQQQIFSKNKLDGSDSRDQVIAQLEPTANHNDDGLVNESGGCLSFSDGQDSNARTFFLPVEYSSFGHAAATGDFDGDGDVDMAISAPHFHIDPLVPSQGAVFILPGRSVFASAEGNGEESGTDVRSVASQILYGDPEQPQSRFGWSLAVVDMNQDGIDDLAIGSPGYGAKGLEYDGAVFVYFGHKGTGLSKRPDLVIHHDRDKDVTDRVPPRMNALTGLGRVLQGLDLTGTGYKDLIMGMPTAITPIRWPLEKRLSTDASRNNDNGNDVNIDEDHRMEDSKPRRFNPQAGKVLVFLSAGNHTGHKLDTQRDWEVQGEDAFGWFGASFAVVSQIYPQHIKTKSKKWSIQSLTSILKRIQLSLSDLWGWSRRASYDYEDKSAELRRILVVGSPAFGVGEAEAMRGKIEGFVIPDLLKRYSHMPATAQDNRELLEPQKAFTIHGNAKFQQLGSSLSGTRHISSKTPIGAFEPEYLIVGSQSEDVLRRLPQFGRLWQAGMVRILDITTLSDGTEIGISDLDADKEIIRDSLQGSQSMAHLSAAMEVSTNGRSLWLTEPYAKAEAGRLLEWVPSFEKTDDKDVGRRKKIKQNKKDVLGVRGRQLAHGCNNDGVIGEGDGDGDDDEDPIRDGIKQCFIGTDFRGRFGSQLLVGDLNKDGRDDVVVTSSHSSQYATMAGTVTIKFRP